MRYWPAILVLFLSMISSGYPVLAADPVINEIAFESEAGPINKEIIHIRMNRFSSPEIFGIEGEEPRLVCDFINVKPATTLKRLIETKGKLIRQVRVGIHSGLTPKTRVVLDLLPNQDYVIHQIPSKKDAQFSISVQLATGESNL